LAAEKNTVGIEIKERGDSKNIGVRPSHRGLIINKNGTELT
jgi:hypothetical protein